MLAVDIVRGHFLCRPDINHEVVKVETDPNLEADG